MKELIKMSNVTLYSNGCPRCNVLKAKLDDKNIEYSVVDNVDEIVSKGFTTVPMLIVDGKELNFHDAVAWVNGVIS